MPNRRDVLKAACGIAVLAAGATLFNEEAFAADGITRQKNGKVAVDVTVAPGLKKVGGAVNLGMVKGAPVALVRTGNATYEAINLRCTHQGVRVEQQGPDWICPAHGSEFTLSGAVVRGPARTPLAKVSTRVRGNKVIVG